MSSFNISDWFTSFEQKAVAEGKKIEEYLTPYVMQILQFLWAVIQAAEPAIKADTLIIIQNALPAIAALIGGQGEVAAGVAAEKVIAAAAPELVGDIRTIFAKALLSTAKLSLPAPAAAPAAPVAGIVSSGTAQ